jgi:hypothetical protein
MLAALVVLSSTLEKPESSCWSTSASVVPQRDQDPENFVAEAAFCTLDAAKIFVANSLLIVMVATLLFSSKEAPVEAEVLQMMPVAWSAQERVPSVFSRRLVHLYSLCDARSTLRSALEYVLRLVVLQIHLAVAAPMPQVAP